MSRARVPLAVLMVLLALRPNVSAAEPPAEDSPAAATASPGLGAALLEEARRYLRDGEALATSPLHWDGEDLRRFGAFAASLGILLAADEQTYAAIQLRRSATTDAIADATTDFGGPYAWAISGGLIAGGLIARNPAMRDTGRDALEAAAFASLFTLALKPVFGRERPYQSDGQTVFRGFTTQYTSFPSNHATTAFAVASVVAMRTDGWIVPTIAYALATLVAFDRVNDQKHFVGDVFAGAVLGVAVGRFIVGRHREEAAVSGAQLEIVPIGGGIGARLTF